MIPGKIETLKELEEVAKKNTEAGDWVENSLASDPVMAIALEQEGKKFSDKVLDEIKSKK